MINLQKIICAHERIRSHDGSFSLAFALAYLAMLAVNLVPANLLWKQATVINQTGRKILMSKMQRACPPGDASLSRESHVLTDIADQHDEDLASPLAFSELKQRSFVIQQLSRQRPILSYDAYRHIPIYPYDFRRRW